MMKTKKLLALLLAVLMVISTFALSASAYSNLSGSDTMLAKKGELVGMITVYKNYRYGDNGTIRFNKMKSVTITSKGDTYAELLGDQTYVKFNKSGKAVIKTVAQVYDTQKNQYFDDTYSFTFYVTIGDKYIVIFEPNGGTGGVGVYSGNKTILKGDQPHYTRTGYTLDGWAKGPNSTAEYSGNITAYEKAPLLLYAHWKPNTYTLSFNANGGSVSPTSKSVTYNTAVGTLPTPTRTGYKFTGWFTAADNSGYEFSSTSKYPYASNTTLYAHWTKLTEIKSIAITGITEPVVGATPATTGYKVPSNVKVSSFKWTEQVYGDTYTGTSDTTFKSGKKYGVSFTLKPADGYAFAAEKNMTATINGKTAKYTNPSQGVYYVSYVFGAPLEKVSSVMITGVSEPSYGAKVTTTGIKASAGFEITNAYWSKKQSNGTYQQTTDTTFQRGGEYSLYISGKIASGYAVPSTLSVTIGSRKATVKHNGGEYFAASYNYDPVIQKVWVTFDPDGGTIAATEKNKLVTVGSTYGALPTPTKSGKSFDGWYDGSTKITSTSKVQRTADHTLVAHWKDKTPTTVTVTFDPNGGTMLASEKTKTVTVGSSYGTLPIPTRAGYTFNGWFNAANNQITATSSVTVSSNHTLTAKWTKDAPKTVTVTFDASPGLVSPTSKTVTVGEKYGDLPIPYSSGRKFLGWYDGDTLVNALSTVTKTENHTLKAKWQVNNLVTFNADGGTVTPESKSYPGGAAYGELPVPTREGYTFDGWYDENDVLVTDTSIVPNVTFSTLTAKWTPVASTHTDHTYVTTIKKATLTKDGKITKACSVCGEVASTKKIRRPETFTLSATKFTYNGKAQKPTVTVRNRVGNVIAAKYYKVTYKNNKEIGTATVTLTFKTRYKGTKDVDFQIVPKGTAIKKLVAAEEAFKISWKKRPAPITGYQIQYATNKKFSKNVKVLTIKDPEIGSATIKSLNAKTTYFVRVRTYQRVEKKNYYSNWSEVLSVKTK